MRIVVEDVFDFVDEPGRYVVDLFLPLVLHHNILDGRRGRPCEFEGVGDFERMLLFLVLAEAGVVGDGLVLLFEGRELKQLAVAVGRRKMLM